MAGQVPISTATNGGGVLPIPTPERITDEEREAIAKAKVANTRAVQDSRESVWFLKLIAFEGQNKKIITQNYNGPCSFIAICNILILRGDIEILPLERTSVSYEFLSQLVGEYLLRASPDVDISAALTMMPLTQKGMDLNPLFSSHTSFRPAGDAGALKLFEQANIPLVHGWLVDPASPEYHAVAAVEDYDNAVNLIVEADTLTRGQFVTDDSVPGPSSNSAVPSLHAHENWSEEDSQKVANAVAVRNFIDTTSSQLTYHGLFTLASSQKPGALVALFRGSHLSVLYKPCPKPKVNGLNATEGLQNQPSSSSTTPTERPEQPIVETGPIPTSHASNPGNAEPEEEEQDQAIYVLVTDHVFLHEPSVVWERLDDVDGSSSSFVDSDFRRSAPVGGDWAGQTAEHVAALLQQQNQVFPEFDPADQDLARKLQAEEDARAHEIYVQRERQRQLRLQQQYPQQGYGPRNSQQQYMDPRDPRFQQYQQQQQTYHHSGPPQQGSKPIKMKRQRSCIIM